MWLLRLNHWLDKVEYKKDVCIAETKEELEAYVEKHKVEPYTDEGERNWLGTAHRVFFDDELKMYNLPDEEDSFIKLPTLEEYIQGATEGYLNFIANVRKI